MIQILHWSNPDFDSISRHQAAAINRLLKQLTDTCREYTDLEIQDFLDQDLLRVVVYTDDVTGELAGMAVLKLDETKMFTRNFQSGYIGDVVVDRRFHRRGIAEELMRFLINMARENGLAFISLTSNATNPRRQAAIRLYEKLGFQKIGELNGSNYYRLHL